MDGSLDDPAWGLALAVADFVRIDAGGGQIRMTNVTARLMRDNAWLYIGFDIAHPLPLTVVPVYRHGTIRSGRIASRSDSIPGRTAKCGITSA